MTDLATRYLGLDLAHPVVASSSPLTDSIDSLLDLQRAGAAAVVLPSLFEEQIESEALAFESQFGGGVDLHVEAAAGYLPDLGDPAHSVEHHLELLSRAKHELSIPVIASLNGTTEGGWTSLAKSFEERGADALELNVYIVAADADSTAGDVEGQYLRLVESVRTAVAIPLTVKIGPQFSSPVNMARRLGEAGADGLVLFNRFYQPDIDLDTLEVTPNLQLSRSIEMRLALRWIAIMSGQIDVDLAATTGVHTAEDVVKLVLVGADVVTMASALLRHGTAHLTSVLDGMQSWFADRDYSSLAQARGSLDQASVPDPVAFERANYMKVISSYRTVE